MGNIPLFFGFFNYLFHFPHDMFIAVFIMRLCAVHTAFDSVFQIYEIAAACVTQAVERAVAEEAVEIFFLYIVAGEILTVSVLDKLVMFHCVT